MKPRNFVKIPLMRRVFTLLSLIAIGVFSSGSQPPDNILRDREDRDHDIVISGLLRLKEENARSFVGKNFDYSLGRSAAAAGRQGLAVSNLQSVVDRDSSLKPYALKHLSQIARSTGNLMLERLYLAEMELESPSSLPSIGAGIRRARNRLESGDNIEAIRLLEQVSNSHPHSGKGRKGDTREPRVFLATAYLRTGDTSEAKDIFQALIDENPDGPDDHSLTAAQALDLMEKNDSSRVPELSEEEHFRRAHIYSFNREFADAEKHLLAIVDKIPAGSRAGDAVFQIGRGYAQLGDHAEALKWFERVLERYSDSQAAKDALLYAASAYSRVGKSREAISRYQSFISKYPSDEKLDRAYLNIIDVLRDQGSDTEALKWCGTVQEVFGAALPSTIALFTEARIYIAREEWENARVSLEKLLGRPDFGGTSVPGGTSTAEVLFLRAFVLEQTKRYPEAIEAYLSVPDGRAEYYGGRATDRLRSLATDEESRSFADQKIGALYSSIKSGNPDTRSRDAKAALRMVTSPELKNKALDILRTAAGNSVRTFESKISPSNDPASLSAAKLWELGIYDEAAAEYEFINKVANGHFLATLYNKGDRADRALALIESSWKKVPADFPLEVLPRDQLRLLYPAPFAGDLIRYGGSRNVDPRFLLAIMRQESRFDPDAKSAAAARGLMQFISSTSTRIAGQLGRNSFVQEDLYHPPTAILFGSQYLSELFGKFPEQPEAVAASYNGGDDNMARWLNRARSGKPERYVPEIVYSQTKDYVTKVMANYRVYQFLYDENLRPRTE